MISRKAFIAKMTLAFLSAIAYPKLSTARTNTALQLYVAQNGSDNWSGQLSEPNPTKTDGPYATIKQARNAIRELKQRQGGLKQPVSVFVRGGTYFLTEPLLFTAEDSGTEDFPVTYAAYQDEQPIISGGRRVDNWQQESVNGHSVWVAKLSDKGQWQPFRNLWVNGERRYRSRYPDRGYLVAAENPPGVNGWFSIGVREEDYQPPLSQWTNYKDAKAIIGTRWAEQHMSIKNIDSDRIYFSHGCSIQTYPGCAFYLENSLDFLSTPGEWCIDSGRLYYFPKPGEEKTVEAIAPVLKQLVLLQGTKSVNNEQVTYQFVEHLKFQGLTFSHTNWEIPPGNASFRQAAINIGGTKEWAPCSGIIQGEGVRYCSWEKCSVEHVGSWAIDFGLGCTHNQVAQCKLFDLGAGGVRIGSSNGSGYKYDDDRLTHSNKVTDCHIYSVGRVFLGAAGIWIGQSYNNLIARNHIHDLHYVGVSLGWTWGYGGKAKDNIVEFNHIHHIGNFAGELPFLNDLGAIYLLGVQPGTIIRNNLIHDIDAYKIKGWGIYIDEGGSYIVIENNLVYRTLSGGFHQHYGKENIIRNNIFAYGKQAQLQRSRIEKHRSFTFERNIVYYSQGKMLVGRWRQINCLFDRNLYWHSDGEDINFSKYSWGEWRDRGMDRHSAIANPLFVAPKQGDFRLESNSPAAQIGFTSQK